MNLAILCLFSFGATLVLIPFVRRLAIKLGMVDHPGERRSDHLPTPRGGGVAVALVTIFVLLLSGDVGSISTTVLAGAAALGIVGFFDDLKDLSAAPKFILQLLIVGFVIYFAQPFATIWLPFVGPIPLGFLAPIVTGLFVLGSLNIFNFMDGIDGLAGTQSLVVSGIWVAYGSIFQVPEAVVFGSILGASSIGFLFMNWHPASIFLGDSGSLYLGFLLSLAPVGFPAAPGGDSQKLFSLTFAVFWPFIFDTVSTRIYLLVTGGHFFAPHRTHIYQRMTDHGWKASSVCFIYGALAVASVLPIILPRLEFGFRSILMTTAFAVTPITLLFLVQKKIDVTHS